MNTKNDGGAAFPSTTSTWSGGIKTVAENPGMSLRDWFAGQALIGLLHPGWEANAVNKPDLPATEAYRLADAMLKAREVSP